MFPTAPYDSKASRFAPHPDYIDIEGYDLTGDGSAAKLQVRERRNGGAVCADVVPALSLSVDGEGLPTTRVSWTIPEAAMKLMPLDPADPAADVTLFLDCLLTPDGEPKFVPFEGTFTIKAGVTE